MSDSQITARLNEVLSHGESAVLCTLIEKIGHGPRNLGAKMLVTADGTSLGTIGGGSMERLLVKEALEALAKRRPRTLHFALGVTPREGMISIDSKCGGEVKVYIDVIKPEPRLFVFGSGWIAQASARYARECGFEVIIVDDAQTAKQENFLGMTVVNSPYPASLKEIDIRGSDYVAVLHGETPFELSALRTSFKAHSAYVGLLGSENKARRHKETLKAEGLDEVQLETLHAPIGVEIYAETPNEIGVSVVAELIQRRRS